MAFPLPQRRSSRALLLDESDRVLLVEHTFTGGTVWTAPGGGVEEGESAIGALTRELHEELGLILPRDAKFATAWVQHLPLKELRIQGFSGVINEVFLVRVPHFEPTPGVAATAEGYPTREGIIEARWWSTPEMHQAASEGTKFGPRDLPTRLPALLVSVADGTYSSAVILGP